MKIPSLSKLFEDASATFKRFPFVILASMLGAFVMIYVIHVESGNAKDYQFLYNAVMCCGLGISFLLSISLRNEVFKLESAKKYIIQGVGVALLIVYYLWLPKELSVVDITRYLLFGLGFHFLVSFTPFMNKDVEHQQNVDAFWRYNKMFFLRILVAVLFSGVLYAGLSVAILSFDKLFNVDIQGKIYAELFFFILGVFNTWFFLSGIPKNLNSFYEEEIYPKGLKIFTQFVLLPLVTIYLVILYLYMGKIIVLWSLPAGWVSYLILCFSIAGIFSLLLIYPIRNYEENRWIKVFSKSFYIALLPLIVLLFVAILTRLFAYGITERRYFVFILACWLSFISLYFLISKTKNIKLIPITLCLLCFATSFGPWGAFAVSQRSQVKRLEKLLTENKILIDGKIIPVKEKVSGKDVGNISSIMDFLSERNELNSIQNWFGANIDSVLKTERYGRSAKVMKLMGLTYKNYYRGDYSEENGSTYKESFTYNFKQERIYNVKDFNYYLNFSLYEYKNNSDDSLKTFAADSVKIKTDLSSSSELMVSINNRESIRYNLKDFLKDLKEDDTYKAFPSEKGIITLEDSRMKIIIHLENIYGNKENENFTVTSIKGDMFVKLK